MNSFLKSLCVLSVLCGFHSAALALDREAFTFTDYNLTVNIDPGLTDSNGPMVCRVDVNADGDRYKGDAQWWIEGEAGIRREPLPHDANAALAAAL